MNSRNTTSAAEFGQVLIQFTAALVGQFINVAIITTLFGAIAGIIPSRKYTTYQERFWNRLPDISVIGCVVVFLTKLVNREVVHGEVIVFWQSLSDSGWLFVAMMFIVNLLTAFSFTKWLARYKGYWIDRDSKYHTMKCALKRKLHITEQQNNFEGITHLLDEYGTADNNGSAIKKDAVPKGGGREPKTKVNYNQFFHKIKQLATEFRDSFAGQYTLETGSSTQATTYSQVMYQNFIAYYAILLDVGIKKHYGNTPQYRAERRKLMKEFKDCRGISAEVAENYLTKENIHKMIAEIFDDLRKRSRGIPSSIYLKLADVELDSVLDTLKQD